MELGHIGRQAWGRCETVGTRSKTATHRRIMLYRYASAAEMPVTAIDMLGLSTSQAWNRQR
jgi:hypothetical protein